MMDYCVFERRGVEDADDKRVRGNRLEGEKGSDEIRCRFMVMQMAPRVPFHVIERHRYSLAVSEVLGNEQRSTNPYTSHHQEWQLKRTSFEELFSFGDQNAC